MHPANPMQSPFEGFNPQVLQAMSMLASLQNMNIPSGLPGFTAVPAIAPVPAAVPSVGAPQGVAVGVGNVADPAIHPNLELAGDVASLQQELKTLREEFNRKRPVDNEANADDEADLSKRAKRSKKKEQEPKRYITVGSVNSLSTQQMSVRSDLMVRSLSLC
jgi:hypothetical protein